MNINRIFEALAQGMPPEEAVNSLLEPSRWDKSLFRPASDLQTAYKEFLKGNISISQLYHIANDLVLGANSMVDISEKVSKDFGNNSTVDDITVNPQSQSETEPVVIESLLEQEKEEEVKEAGEAEEERKVNAKKFLDARIQLAKNVKSLVSSLHWLARKWQKKYWGAVGKGLVNIHKNLAKIYKNIYDIYMISKAYIQKNENRKIKALLQEQAEVPALPLTLDILRKPNLDLLRDLLSFTRDILSGEMTYKRAVDRSKPILADLYRWLKVPDNSPLETSRKTVNYAMRYLSRYPRYVSKRIEIEQPTGKEKVRRMRERVIDELIRKILVSYKGQDTRQIYQQVQSIAMDNPPEPNETKKAYTNRLYKIFIQRQKPEGYKQRPVPNVSGSRQPKPHESAPARRGL